MDTQVPVFGIKRNLGWQNQFSLGLGSGNLLVSTTTLQAQPNDWEGLAKLIQSYQANGNIAQRDAIRDELFTLYESGTDPDLGREESYCREQFAL